MNFNQYANYYGDENDDDSLNDPIFQINQAAQGIWYQALNMEEWKFSI